METKKSKLNVVVGILLLLLQMYDIVYGIVVSARYSNYTFFSLTGSYSSSTGLYAWFSLVDLIGIAIFIIFAITLILGKKIAIVAACGLEIIYTIYNLISGIISYGISIYYINGILRIAAYVLLAILMINAVKNKNELVKKVWFVPFVLATVGYIIFYMIPVVFKYGFYSSNLITYIISLLGFLFQLLLPALWFKAEAFPKPAKQKQTVQLNSDTSNSPQQTGAVIGNADLITQYKELLDSGVISQEEFDTKKKQLLG